MKHHVSLYKGNHAAACGVSGREYHSRYNPALGVRDFKSVSEDECCENCKNILLKDRNDERKKLGMNPITKYNA